ncbi:hypothetical protein ACFZ8E_25020 [Methylobacterium sp. HMF5984]|uniref:hypothetical protein n=1 Tax=Methylobacterium sp. HMF5984 TaxID=3367370 RepID=UPI00385484D3
MTFADHPCFAAGTPGVFTRGEACASLSASIAKTPEAREAFLALGDPHDPARRARALAVLDALPPKLQAKIATMEARP